MNYNGAFFYHSVTGLDLWGVLVATGAVCIIYCTLVGTVHVKKSEIMYCSELIICVPNSLQEVYNA